MSLREISRYVLVLAIETSCDETSLAFILSPQYTTQPRVDEEYLVINEQIVLFQLVSSQISIHAQFGGVVPEIGARLHAFTIHLLFSELINHAVSRLTSSLYEKVDMKFDFESKIHTTQFQPPLSLDRTTIDRLFLHPYGLTAQSIIDKPQSILKALEHITVTTEPGLPSALRVGREFAKSIAFFSSHYYHTNPLITEVNHLNGHICSAFYKV